MDEYRKFAIRLAKESGKIIKENFTLGMKKTWKADGTPLTITDTTINSFVIQSVIKYFPDHGVLGEEEKHHVDASYLWVCDPVDGTYPFSHGIPTSVFSLALVKDGKPIIGVIYDPYLDRLIVAEKGKGALLNGSPISVSNKTEFSKSLVDIESYKTPHHLVNVTRVRERLLYEGCFTLSLTSSVYGGMLVTLGKLAAVICTSNTPWDGAAIQIMVEEAGGICTDIYGNDQKYNQAIKGFVATNKTLHPKLIQLIKTHSTLW